MFSYSYSEQSIQDHQCVYRERVVVINLDLKAFLTSFSQIIGSVKRSLIFPRCSAVSEKCGVKIVTYESLHIIWFSTFFTKLLVCHE